MYTIHGALGISEAKQVVNVNLETGRAQPGLNITPDMGVKRCAVNQYDGYTFAVNAVCNTMTPDQGIVLGELVHYLPRLQVSVNMHENL